MGYIPVEERLRLLSGQVYAAAEIGMWCFGPEKNLFYSTCPHETEFLSFLKLSSCFDYIYSRKEGWERPLILSDQIGLVWIAEHVFMDGSPSLMIMMGPFFWNRTSLKYIDEKLSERESSIYAKRQMEKILVDVPVIPVQMMGQYAIMLHFSITENKITARDFYYQTGVQMTNGLGEAWDDIAENRSSPDRSHHTEQMILQAVREGNEGAIHEMTKDIDRDGFLYTDTGDVLRDARNTVLIFNALCSRAAVEGGLPVSTAKEVELRYAAEIESCDSMTKLVKLNQTMVGEYISRVRSLRENPGVSKEILAVCDYIKSHIWSEINLDTLAEEAGYTTYYFTKKFYKETGIRINDYIKNAKLEYAKIALISTKKGIQEISDELGFGTRNYFSKVFKEMTGVSPAEYRERLERDKLE